MTTAAAREVSHNRTKAIPAKLTFPEPRTPRRNRHNVLDNVHAERNEDEDGTVHIHVTMPAQLARNVEWSFQMSPSRTPWTAASPVRPIIPPLEFANAPLRRGAPPSPPPSPPSSPSPSPTHLRVPTVAPPRVCFIQMPSIIELNLRFAERSAVERSGSYLPSPSQYLACLGPRAGVSDSDQEILRSNERH